MQQVPVLVPQSSYGDGNTTVVIARIYCILRGCYDVVWGTLEFPSFNFNGIFDGFCILKRMLYMMPLSRHALSLQTGLHRRFILGTVILPTAFATNNRLKFSYLPNPIPLKMFDRSTPSNVSQKVRMPITFSTRETHHLEFFVTNLDENYSLVLGYDWLA